jgi:chromosome segregation ATPase
MSLAKHGVLIVATLGLASCDKPTRPPAEKTHQEVAAKPCDVLTVWQDTETELATLRALERELTADSEAKRARADSLMRAGQDEKAIKSAVDDLHDAQEQLIKVKERLIVTERKFAELNDSQRNTRSDREKKEQEVATLQALATELNVDLDGKKSLLDAMKQEKVSDREIEQARRDYHDAQEQLLKLKERLVQANSELRDLEKNP